MESPSVAAAVSGARGQAPLEADTRSSGSNARTLVTGIVFGLQARWGATASIGCASGGGAFYVWTVLYLFCVIGASRMDAALQPCMLCNSVITQRASGLCGCLYLL